MSIRSAAAALAAFVVLASGAGAATLEGRYSSLAVLGDSLSDPGNLFAQVGVPPSPPYFNGRFSNGPVYADLLAQDFGALGRPVVNVAFGGAQAATDGDFIPDLPAQLGLLAANLPAAAVGANGLGIVFAGANDILGTVGAGDAVEAARDAARAVVDAARALRVFGFAEVAVFTLLDLGQIPRFQLVEPLLADEASAATAAFNRELRRSLRPLGEERRRVRLLDAAAFLNDTLAGVAQPVLPCLSTVAALDTVPACEGFAFFDDVHPTAAVHAAFADYVEAELLAPPPVVPLPAAGLLLVTGLGGFAVLRRRRSVAP
jgi:outer membrane lipase/esterase